MKPAIEGGEPVRKNYLMFGSPDIREDEIKEVVETLKSGWIGTGPRVAKFEEEFKNYIGCKYARALNSCTAGLHLSMIVSGVKRGDEVITTPLTFAATANVIHHVGAKPVFVDINRDTINISPEMIEKAITPKTKAIIPVHIAGRPCEMDRIMEITKKNNLIVIEDAAHAIEAKYKGKKIGNISDLTAFSFYVTKNLITGEGGMVTTNRKEWADDIEAYGLHGLNKGAWKRYSDDGFKHYEVIFPGYKYNMMDIQAAMGIHQLKRIETNLKIREKIWNRYNEAFKDLPVFTPTPWGKEIKHARHLYILLLDTNRLKVNRDRVQEALHRENIGTGIHFVSLHLHKFYREFLGHIKGDFPNAEFISDRTISLPLSPKLTDQDVEDIITAVRRVVNYYKK